MASPQSESALLQLPSEIRNQIFHLVFSDHHVIMSRSGPPLAQDDCRACIDLPSDQPPWVEVVRPLRTCKQILNEAKDILFSSFKLHFGTDLAELPLYAHRVPRGLKNNVRRLEWRVHIHDQNREDWKSSIPSIGNLFPNLEQVVIHAHMRPPSSYDVLLDGVYLALPVVLLSREMPDIQLSFDMAYTFSGIMFESPFLGDITTEDALDEHELVIRDVMADEEFIELAMEQGAEFDMQALTTVLLRCARAHEQVWFEKLQRKRLARQTATTAGQSEQPGHS